YGDGWNGVNGAVRGLFYGDPGQFVAQCIGGLANFAGVGVMALVAYKVTALVVGGHRVAPEVEELGLDLPEMGALAYPDTPDVATAVMLNALAVVLDKPYDAARFSAGFHAELLVGQDATVIQSNGFNLGAQADVPHLYVTLNVPTASGNGLQFKVGRIPTLMGLEVIETVANPSLSEGNQFIYVEDFTGTGLSVETKFNNYVDLQLRVINGWNQVADNNSH